MTTTDLTPEDGRTAAPPRVAVPSPAPARRPALTLPPLIALSLGYFLVMLDVTVVNVAVPEIRTALDTGASALQWIVDGYSTVFAGLLLLGGGLADRLGHRRMFLTGLGVFTGASLVCGLAGTPGALIAGRLAQGAGAALLVPASLALLQATYPDRAVRARAIAVWGAVASIAFGAGPAVGGLLVSGLEWRSVFWLNLPVAALAVVLTVRHIPATARKKPARRMDPAGQVLGIVGLVSLAGGLNEAGSHGWTSPLVLTAFGAGAACLTAFALVERSLEARERAGHGRRAPLLPPSLFRSGAFTSTAAIGLLISLGYYGMLFLTTLYFQQERGFTVLDTGLALLPSVCMGLVAAPLFSRLAARTGPYVPMAGGLALGAVGFLGWLTARPDTPYPVLLFALIATGLGQTMTALAATAAIIETAPASGAGIASAVFNVARQVGSAVGVALFGTLAAAAGDFTSGLRLSAGIAAAAFAVGAVLAVGVRRRAAGRTT
ncbi:DHA2 family efflux MFS transporter permease subunit [Streptomyces sp. AK04-3B]|uniref:MFS transporter n=1 Tax=unclassified Streptomyces TaxID=2593676 RepID=UPI0029A456FA|nr:DHA2 family efflux MFS transporter permease subunit [Streptomyces sp. AK04-3B]MDX3799621.1 DHA2 family efflux MFS transporter permease subunit [Streptomyces sp. AK04-3B]